MTEEKIKKDLYWEHDQHTTYQEECSTCFSENNAVKVATEKGKKGWVGRLMTRIIWGDKVADSGWIDPLYR